MSDNNKKTINSRIAGHTEINENEKLTNWLRKRIIATKEKFTLYIIHTKTALESLILNQQ